MPLPAALFAKLQKRGIVKDKRNEGEEVFAENYDESEEEGSDEEEEVRGRGGAPGCPNKWNQYHMCTDYCYDHWQEGLPENRLSDEYLTAKEKMLQKYPLPAGWREVYDAGLARHYYWNVQTDEVCWLSPMHPCANAGKSAPVVAEEFYKARQKVVAYDEEDEEEDHRGRRGGHNRRDRNQSRWGDRQRYLKERDERREKHVRDQPVAELEPESIDEMPERDRLRRARRKGLDPMDPSAYSDCPEGNWGAGLNADAKTGADTTASGPLFQSRPYPAPGAIMRRNQQ